MTPNVLTMSLTYGANLLFVVTVVCLCFWARRHAPLKSPPWVAANVILSSAAWLINPPAMRHVIQHYRRLFDWQLPGRPEVQSAPLTEIR
jgi:hypothetical protein